MYLIATNDKLAHPIFQICASEELSLEAPDQINKLPQRHYKIFKRIWSD